MNNYRSILYVVDPARPETPGLYRAIALAKASDAVLHLVSFPYINAISALMFLNAKAGNQAKQGYMQQQRQLLEAQKAGLQRQGLEVRCDVIWARHEHKAICECAKELEVDLIVKDMHTESGLATVLPGPTDWHLLRHAPAALHLVKGVSRALPKCVVAAVDPQYQEDETEHVQCAQVIRAANQLAMVCNAQLELLHVAETIPTYALVDGGYFAADVLAALEEQQRASFSALADEFGVPSEACHLIVGSPLGAVSGFVETNHVDVIVVGRTRGDAFAWLGSFTETLLSQPPCSILALGKTS